MNESRSLNASGQIQTILYLKKAGLGLRIGDRDFESNFTRISDSDIFYNGFVDPTNTAE